MMRKTSDITENPKSQRQNGYHSGIQPGMCASTEKSKKSDLTIKQISHRIAHKFIRLYPDRIVYKQTIGQDLLPTVKLRKNSKKCPKDCQNSGTNFSKCGCKGSITPDGGVFLFDGKIILSLESKHQGIGGNALERVGTNITTFSQWNTYNNNKYKIDENFLNIVCLSGDANDINSSAMMTVQKVYPGLPFEKIYNNPTLRPTIFLGEEEFSQGFVDNIINIAEEHIQYIIRRNDDHKYDKTSV